jgi:glycerol-3-phosphate O-acyltransferase
VLTSRFGRLNFQVHPPYDLRQALAELGATKASDEQTRTAAVNQLAFRVVRQISQLALVTPTALVSAALLVTGRRTVDRRIVDRISQWLVERLRCNGARISRTLVAPPAEERGAAPRADLLAVRADGLEKALQLLARDRLIQIGGPRDAPAYQLPDERRLSLAYYRNGLINFLTAESIVARAVLTVDTAPADAAAAPAATELVPREEVMHQARLLSRLFKHELVFQVNRTFDEIFDETVTRLEGWALRTHGGDLAVVNRLELELLALLLHDFVEGYWAAAVTLTELLAGPVGRKALLGRMADSADRLYYRGELHRQEACSKTLHSNALAALLDMGVLTESVGRSRRGPPVALGPGYDSAEALDAFLRSIAVLRGSGQPSPGSDLTAPLGLGRDDP